MTPRSYFDERYDGDDDPWGFDERWYERRKFALTVAALPRRHYAVAVEAGCSNGALTERLAERCDRLYAFDFVPAAVRRARERLRNREHVRVLEASFPDYWPAGPIDLVVWSEVAYYVSGSRADAARQMLERRLEPMGDVVAVHYSGATDHPRHGLEIGPWLDEVPSLDRLVTHRDEQFELIVWRKTVG